jgi:hypothetical protein
METTLLKIETEDGTVRVWQEGIRRYMTALPYGRYGKTVWKSDTADMAMRHAAVYLAD